MESRFFVMLYNQKGDYAEPMVNDDGEVYFWKTSNDAREAMRGHMYAEAFGFEVHGMRGDCG